MGYGDAYVYCVIIDTKTVNEIQRVLFEIEHKTAMIDEILASIEVECEPNPARGEKGLQLMKERGRLYGKIIDLCHMPIAIHHIASDDWLDAWHRCSTFNFVPMKVSNLVKRAQDKMWCGETLTEHYNDEMCICIPSHYDTDDELMQRICGCDNHKDYQPRY